MFKKILLIPIIVLLLFIFVGCGEDKIQETSEIVCMNGEIYFDETNEGVILTGIVSYPELGVKRSQITAYGFAYCYSCPSTNESIVIGKEGIYEVTIEDVDSSNSINCVISVPEEYYNIDIAFRPFIRYTDSDNNTKVLYSSDYNAFNLYELAKKDNSEFAQRIVDFVEKNK